MEMFKRYFVIFVLLLSQTGFTQKIPDCKLANEYLEQLISKKANELQGEEFCQFRHYNSINDLDDDGIDDFIVVYTVEGVLKSASNYLDFMMIFLSSNEGKAPLEVQIGGRGDAACNGIERVDKNVIELEMLVWKEDDGLCCPSGKGKAFYQIKDKQIIKIE